MQIKPSEDELPSIPAINSLIEMEKKGMKLVSYAILECTTCKQTRKIKDIKNMCIFQIVQYKCPKCESEKMLITGIFSEVRLKRKNMKNQKAL